MKTRHSLVSNSSSASYIITWEYLKKDDESKDEIIRLLADNDKIKDVILANTQELKSGVFRTSFWTSMHNDISDFGDVAGYLTMELLLANNFRIIDARIEEE